MSKKKYQNSRERFLEVAEARTNSVLNRIRILGHCSNKQLYEYNPEEIHKIFRTIEKQLNQTKQKFSATGRAKKKFRLSIDTAA